MAVPTDLDRIMSGVEDVLVMDDLKAKLALGRPLRVKAGFDPTAPDLHLGHTVLINKLKDFQDLGHEVLFVIGDFTAMIGDPTGKNVTRQPLSKEAVIENAKTYEAQVFKILDPNKTNIVFNATWLQALTPEEFIRLAARCTVARMLERDDFSKRYKAGEGIAIHEFLYPLMQGYDSVAIEADIELGGTDQRFNLLMGRDLQKQMGQPQQVVMTLPLLEGLDGVKKMSKSLGNYIGITEPPEEMYGKVLSISDDLMWRYYELITNLTLPEIKALKAKVANGENPKDIKMALARNIVTRFHGEGHAKDAEAAFQHRFKDKGIPEDIPVIEIACEEDGVGIAHAMKEAKLVASTSEAFRLIKQGAVRLEGESLADKSQILAKGTETLVQAGKRRFARLRIL